MPSKKDDVFQRQRLIIHFQDNFFWHFFCFVFKNSKLQKWNDCQNVKTYNKRVFELVLQYKALIHLQNDIALQKSRNITIQNYCLYCSTNSTTHKYIDRYLLSKTFVESAVLCLKHPDILDKAIHFTLQER